MEVMVEIEKERKKERERANVVSSGAAMARADLKRLVGKFAESSVETRLEVIREMLSLLPLRVEVLSEEIRSSVPLEDDGGFLLTSCRLALLEHSEAISFDSVKPIDSWSRGIGHRLLVEPTSESLQQTLSLEMELTYSKWK
ncbi:unnamed protein product [Protopolystoma xenopodis]|uniref:Uncharacterized protein n=1 Tax=Protopolystoma xenopodis TaxID=117903 RepID=A0A3S5CVG4_9PLAT|nr:unnamed protein product [Protopolystoma xenopodis]